MQQALALAALGYGRTGENPSVGCVIVRDGEVVAEGRTAEGGRPHAEEAALAQAGENARGATVFVTLEPCARRSSGGVSCSDLLIQAGVSRVVIAAQDPHPFAAGAGVARLQEAGASVESGLLEDQALAMNPIFFAKWARVQERYDQINHAISCYFNFTQSYSEDQFDRFLQELDDKAYRDALTQQVIISLSDNAFSWLDLLKRYEFAQNYGITTEAEARAWARGELLDQALLPRFT